MTTRKPRTTKAPVTIEAPADAAQIIAELKAQIEAANPKVEPEPVIDMASVVADLQKQIAELKTVPEPQVAPIQVVEHKAVKESVVPQVIKGLSAIPFGTISAWIAAFVGIFLWWQSQQPKTDSKPDDKPKATISSVLDEAYKADRKGRIATLRELETKSFKSDQEKLEWLNSEAETKRQINFREYLDRMADAVYHGQTGKMANDLEAGK